MPSSQHPFADSRYARLSRSAETLTRWLRGEGRDEGRPLTSDPATRPASQAAKRAMVPVSPALGESEYVSRPPIVASTSSGKPSKTSAQHYVKHSSKLTLLLSDQDSGVEIPVYVNGDTIDGILAVARPAGLLSLDIMVRVQISEFALKQLTRSRLRAR